MESGKYVKSGAGCDYQYEILNHPDYQAGEFDIEFIADKEQELLEGVTE